MRSFKPQMKLANTIYVVLSRSFPSQDFLITPRTVKRGIAEIVVAGKIIGQVTKLWTGKMFTSEKNKKKIVETFKIYDEEKQEERKNCREFPLLWKLLGSIYSLPSFVTRR